MTVISNTLFFISTKKIKYCAILSFKTPPNKNFRLHQNTAEKCFLNFYFPTVRFHTLVICYIVFNYYYLLPHFINQILNYFSIFNICYRKTLLAGIFYRCTNQIDFLVIYNQKTIMKIRGSFHT